MPATDPVVSPLIDTRTGLRTSADPRVIRTRQAILDAVESLVAQGASNISVSDIVRSAGIGRSSFYTHFAGIDELAVEVLRGAFDAIGADDIEMRMHAVPGAAAARRAQERFVEHLVQHRSLYASMLSLPFTSQVLSAAVDGYAAQVRATMAVLPNAPAGLLPDAVATYVASGSLGLVASWVLSDDPIAPAVLVDQLMGLLPSWLAAP